MRPLLVISLALLAGCARAPAGARGAAAAPAPTSWTLGAEPITRPGYRNETTIAIDPARPSRVVAAWQIPATVGWSEDGGLTWSSRFLPEVARWQLSGDPVVAVDADGHAYAMYIAFDRPEDYDTLGRAAHRNGIFINRSDDGGRSWRATPTAVIEQPERPGIPFEDKPAFGVDRSSDRARRGAVYAAWTEFRRRESVILFARSTDGARTFSAPIEISDRAGSPKDSVGADEGTDVEVAPDGTVYVVWSDSTGVLIDRSTDGGRTFGADVRIARTPDIVFGVPGVERANGYPSLEIDPRSGRLYVAWVDVRRGPPEPFLSYSDDGGRTWSAPAPVGAREGDARPRFFAWLTVDPLTGLVALGYYRGADETHLEYVLATSGDGGRTFTERPWSARPFAPRGEFLGDYTGIDALGGTIVSAWTEVAAPDSGTVLGLARPHGRIVIGRAVAEGTPSP
ncbi:MAG TPA: sialidase family protein [Gemmatimonadaceae bacterium]|nr:sialidase family protein [Gemmatimonadaceae bacterium]